jgi:signal transduction histidine kinase
VELREHLDAQVTSLRSRLFGLVGVVVALTVVLVTATVASSARRAFAAVDAQRTAALVTQIRQQFAAEGEQVAQLVERVATSDTMITTANLLRRSNADSAALVGEAAALAAAQGLDFLDLVSDRGTIISSAHTPARFGYRHPWLKPGTDIVPAQREASLQRVESSTDVALGLIATRTVSSGDHPITVIGGRRLDEHFIGSLAVPAGMRVVLYRNIESEISQRQFVDASGIVADSRALEPLVARVRHSRTETNEQVPASGDTESVTAIPLPGRDGTLLGVLLVASSGSELSALMNRIRWSGLLFGAVGIVFGCALSYVVASRITRPVEQLADASRAIASGQWDVRTNGTDASGEIGALANAFDVMTRQLAEQRDRLVQAERVAAWRELARRLAHELKNPLFPLRITTDNLRRAKTLGAAEFDEVFDESLDTLTTGLTSLTAVVGQFSDFARMPVPTFSEVSPNEVARSAVRMFQAQLGTGSDLRPGRRDGGGEPAVAVTLDLDASIGSIQADGEQLGRALMNLLLNAIDAMPNGGDLTIRTRRHNDVVRLEVSDTGQGLTVEERQRLFTPYYTTKKHGTGLGLAIVQSVVADHHGRIWVESEPGRGTTFHIELPAAVRGTT